MLSAALLGLIGLVVMISIVILLIRFNVRDLMGRKAH